MSNLNSNSYFFVVPYVIDTNYSLTCRMKNHLEPLAWAANITQTAQCHVYDVLITFAYLHFQYSSLTDPDDAPACNAILSSIERRWKKTDQDVFIAGILLNPFHKAQPFCAAPFSTSVSLYNLIHRLWSRFYSETPPAGLYIDFKAYINGTGDYLALRNFMNGMWQAAEKEVRCDMCLNTWHKLTFHFRAWLLTRLKSGKPSHTPVIPQHHLLTFLSAFSPYALTQPLSSISGVHLRQFSVS